MKTKHLSFGFSIICAFCIAFFTHILFTPNIKNSDAVVLIPQHATFNQVVAALQQQNILKSKFRFQITAKLLCYHQIRSGRYLFDKNENSFSIVKKLRRGQHYPVKFTFNNIRTKEQLIEKLSAFDFLFDWNELYNLLNNNDFLAKYALKPDNVIAIFIPDTYEFYYDISAQDFFEKMYGYYQQFWSEYRRIQAGNIELSPMEITILASIVEEENFREKEKAIIAGLYINRLHKNMLLQADPTVKFALGNFALKRIRHEHLNVNSPYNTYRYHGLPPGPIRSPAKSTIDSVLHYQRHNYLYMCAKEDFSGEHRFTDNYQVHLQNARRYQAALSAIGQ